MSKIQKIFISLILLAVLGYGVYVYYDRFWQRGDSQPRDYQSDFSSPQKDNQESEETNSPGAANQTSEQRFQKECSSNCTSLSGEEQKQCFEFCGLTNGTNNQEDPDCGKKTGLERDNCFKDQAVKQKNDSVCENVSDSSVKQSCINAVAEEVLEDF
ncbi:MAG: hypothetical protein ABIC19_04710 [Patescibacteria group bacterium]|nr:hypothetical protein [Patescibacteria group bacterium]